MASPKRNSRTATTKNPSKDRSEASGVMLSLFDMPTAPAPKAERRVAEGPLSPMLFDDLPVKPSVPVVSVAPVRPVALPPLTLTAPPVEPVFRMLYPDNTCILLDESGEWLYEGPADQMPDCSHKTIVHYFQPPDVSASGQPTPVLEAICLGSLFARYNGQFASTKGDYQAKDLDYAVRCAAEQAPSVLRTAFGAGVVRNYTESATALVLLWRWLVGNACRARVLTTLLRLEGYYRGDHQHLPTVDALDAEDHSPSNFRMLRWASQPEALIIQGVPEGPFAMAQCTHAFSSFPEPFPIQSTPMGLRLVRLRIAV